MKKSLSLALVLLLSLLLCMPAMAETTSDEYPIEDLIAHAVDTGLNLATGEPITDWYDLVMAGGPIPLQTQLTYCRDLLASSDFDYSDLLEWDITTDWYRHLVFDKSTSGYMDLEGIGNVKYTFNEDGTANLNAPGRTAERWVAAWISDGVLSFTLINPENMTYAGNVWFYPCDPFSSREEAPTMVSVMGSTSQCSLFYTQESGVIELLSDENRPAPVVEITNGKEITDIASDWALSYGYTAHECMIDSTCGYVTSPDTTLLLTWNSESESLRLSGLNSDSGFTFVEIQDDYGIKFVSGTDISDANADIAIIYLHEDGRLSVHYAGAVYVFEKYTVDPLTEYTDKATVQAVQEAMNAEGYECGTPDGIAGKKTAQAITDYQAANGLTQTGTITYELLQSLRAKGYSL